MFILFFTVHIMCRIQIINCIFYLCNYTFDWSEHWMDDRCEPGIRHFVHSYIRSVVHSFMIVYSIILLIHSFYAHWIINLFFSFFIIERPTFMLLLSLIIFINRICKALQKMYVNIYLKTVKLYYSYELFLAFDSWNCLN